MMVSTSSEREIQAVFDELDRYEVPHDIISPNDVFSKRGRYIELYQLDKETEKLLDVLKELPFDPVYMGVKLGEIVKGRFRPSLEFGSIISQKAASNKVGLDTEHSQMFLFGRDIFKEHLPQGLSLGRKLVCDEDGEFLGYGIYNGRYLANVIDKGAYLRKYD